MILPAPGVFAPVLPAGKLELKYLFGAVFEDDTQYFQTLEDRSVSDPSRNALYDLLEHDESGNCIEHPLDRRLIHRGDVVLFVLQDDNHRYLVDLRDGHFEIQHRKGKDWIGAHFYVATPPPGAKLRFFYRLRRRHHKNVSGVVQQDGSVRVVSEIESGQECEYRFGWETEDHQQRAEIILV